MRESKYFYLSQHDLSLPELFIDVRNCRHSKAYATPSDEME